MDRGVIPSRSCTSTLVQLLVVAIDPRRGTGGSVIVLLLASRKQQGFTEMPKVVHRIDLFSFPLTNIY